MIEEFGSHPSDRITWTRTSAIIPTHMRLHGREHRSRIEIDIGVLGCAKNSFLGEALKTLACPVSKSFGIVFRRLVYQLASDPRTLETLQTPPSLLTSATVKFLFAQIDEAVASWNYRDINAVWAKTTKPFRDIPIHLAGGGLANSTGYRTRHRKSIRRVKEHAANKGTRSAAPSQSRPLAVAPIHSGDFDSLNNRNKQAYETSRAAQEHYKKCCETVLDEHNNLKDLLISLRDEKSPKIAQAISAAKSATRSKYLVTLEEAVHLVEHFKLHQIRPRGNEIYIHLRHLQELESRSTKHGFNDSKLRQELLLSHYYLPSRVVTSCFIAIQLEHLVNSDVISSLTLKSITKTKNGYIFTGIKGRNDTAISKHATPLSAEQKNEIMESMGTDLEFISNLSVSAIELLIENAKCIAKYSANDDVHLLTCINLQFYNGPLQFHHLNISTAIKKWCAEFNLEHFSTNHLRALGAQTIYLSPGGTVFDVQTALNHKNSLTSWEYLETNVIKWLHFANIRRFMDVLAASIFWRLNQKGKLEEYGLNKRKFKPDLLFPIEWGEDPKRCVVDQWLESQGSLKLSFGIDELKQCAYQFHLYEMQVHHIAQSNASAFTTHHMPRILICIALRRIILTSVYASIFRNIEKEIREKL